MMVRRLLNLFSTLAITISFHAVVAFSRLAHRQSEEFLAANTSVLPPGWSGIAECWGDSNQGSANTSQLLLGPNFVDPVGLTIESCVAFCNEQGSQLAGLKATECHCANIFNPEAGFLDVPEDECLGLGAPCPGNLQESCGIPSAAPIADVPIATHIFFNLDSPFNCTDRWWDRLAPLTPLGSWRFSYFYNDSIEARALPYSPVTLPAPLPEGNLTIQACLTACENEGFTIAGVEFGAECFCGNALQSNSQPIKDCSLLDSGSLTPCTGSDNPNMFCGGPDILSLFTLPGADVTPLIPFDPALDNLCPDICGPLNV